MGLDPEHRFLLKARFVGRDNFLNGLARCGIIRMDETQDIRRFTYGFPRSRSPLAGRLPGGESFWKTGSDRFAEKLRPGFRRDIAGWRFR